MLEDSGHFKALKKRMTHFRETHAKDLAQLTKNSHECKQALRSKLDLADRILKLAELARKRETEREKVLPFYRSTVGAAESGEAAAVGADNNGGEMKEGLGERVEVKDDGRNPVGIGADGKPVQEWEYLDTFYKRHNKVLLDKLAIERERERLQRENSELQVSHVPQFASID